jgi:hypothetical protein
VLVENGRSLTIEGVLVERTNEVAIVSSGAGSEVSLTSAMLRDTRTTSGSFGRGLVAQEGGRIEGHFVVVDENRDTGVFASDPGSEIVMSDSLISNTLPEQRDRTEGRGVGIQSDARFEAARVLITGNREVGMYVSGAASQCELTDVVVRETLPQERDGGAGDGIEVRFGARFEAQRLLVARNTGSGIFISDEGTMAHLEGVVVRDTEPPEDVRAVAFGLTVREGAGLEATSLLLSANNGSGLHLSTAATAGVSDVAIRGPSPEDAIGRGINVQMGAYMDATRLLVADRREVALFVRDADAVVRDAVFRDTRGRLGDGLYGRGLEIEGSTTFEAERILVESARDYGVAVLFGAAATLRDAAVVRIEVLECATSTCAGSPDGHGIGVVSAELESSRFEIADAATCGLLLADDPGTPVPTVVNLQDGVIAESSIGACLQVEGYDLSRLSDGVVYRDNGVNLDATSLPVPGHVDTVSDPMR